MCDCATCLSSLKEYNEKFSSKVIDIFELLGEKTSTLIKNETVTYHLPCHLRDKKQQIKSLVEKTFYNYREMTDYDTCCGFSGDFSIKFPKISKKITDKKIKNIQKTKANCILTSCPGCVIGINKGLIENKIKKPVLNLIEYLEINS